MPLLAGVSGPSDGIQISGMIVRVMMFQSLSTEIGITGWMLRMFCVPFSGPKLRFVLFWNGTLIRLPTGFCASFASSSALSSARAGAVAIKAAAPSAAAKYCASIRAVIDLSAWSPGRGAFCMELSPAYRPEL